METEILDQKIKVDDHVLAKNRFDNWTGATVVSIKNDGEGLEYLVHFDETDRRLDIWRSEPDVKPYTHEEDEVLKKQEETSDQKMTRSKQRRLDEINNVTFNLDSLNPVNQELEKEYLERTKIKYTEWIEMGFHRMEAWYYSEYPMEYRNAKFLYICDRCFKYMLTDENYLKHIRGCRYQLTEKLYEKDNLAVFEADGLVQTLFCQNLCLMGKIFLDHKTAYYDIEHFYFYLLYEKDELGYHFAGYFSKEKVSDENYNLSCIMVLPPFQKKGYGKFLVSFSYELSKIEGVVGSPEKPLSDLGKSTYRSYWSYVILLYMSTHERTEITATELSCNTGINVEDVEYILKLYGISKNYEGIQVACATLKAINEFLYEGGLKHPKILPDPSYITWVPHKKFNPN